MKVKCVIFAFCVIFYSSVEGEGEGLNKGFQGVIDKCIETEGVDKKIIYQLYADKNAKTDDPKIKCVFKCILNEIKWLDSNGNIVEGSKLDVPEQDLQFARTCMKFMTDGDVCEKSYNFHKCFIAMKFNAGKN